MRCSFRRSFLGPICPRQATRLVSGLDPNVNVRWKRPACDVCSFENDFISGVSEEMVVLLEGDESTVWEIMES